MSSNTKTRVAIAGINGKMGRASARAILADPELALAGAFGKAGADYVGKDVGELASHLDTGILVSNSIEDLLAGCHPDVLLDFTRAEAAVAHAKVALEAGVCPVVGTSGVGRQDVEELSKLAARAGVGAMIVPNFSVGAVLMMEFARQAGAYFGNVEIVEMHHTKKVDAPSGTAMYTAGKLDALGKTFNPREVEEKELLSGARGAVSASGVRVHSLRLPGLISHQEVICGSPGELLTIRHDSFNTDCFVKGILMSVKAVTGMKGLVSGLESLLCAG